MLLCDIQNYSGKTITLKGWVFNFRSSGSIYFLQFRDGTGKIQIVVSKNNIEPQIFEEVKKITQETSIEAEGKVYPEKKSPYGWEMQAEKIKIIQVSSPYPLGKKSHGPDFLFKERHLWLRSPKEAAILKIRDEIALNIRLFLKQKNFTLTDSPILTPTACEGTTTLFKVDYFGKNVYLSQSGQLYLEALIYSLGRVYDFGPVFRAEKSKTRRHLTEFWMMDAEAAFLEHKENMVLQEEFIYFLIKEILKNCSKELEILERDIVPLKKIKPPFPRITYEEAIKILQKKGSSIKWGDDFGADEEAILSLQNDNPLFVEKYPSKIKAFYMKPDEENPEIVLNDDLLAPEGYGEIIGGSERIWDYELLKQKIQENKLPLDSLKWYLDLRKYGSVPHSGFGLGLERFISWITGIHHIRETIPFPRTMNRIKP
ncbi:MAG: Asparagine--tRNA ligase [Parcubacteria group bacterium ADurb.Bin159]|nr:MAG: Asparagine--tRNA ligase [Parcubacteria group bacterium ADurb.Bin159]